MYYEKLTLELTSMLIFILNIYYIFLSIDDFPLIDRSLIKLMSKLTKFINFYHITDFVLCYYKVLKLLLCFLFLI